MVLILCFALLIPGLPFLLLGLQFEHEVAEFLQLHWSPATAFNAVGRSSAVPTRLARLSIVPKSIVTLR